MQTRNLTDPQWAQESEDEEPEPLCAPLTDDEKARRHTLLKAEVLRPLTADELIELTELSVRHTVSTNPPAMDGAD
jgi:hypothetical protein